MVERGEALQGKAAAVARTRATLKSQLHGMRQRVYDLEGMLSKAKLQCRSMLPWEEVARAFKDDTLEQVMDNRCLRRQVETQRRRLEVLQGWIQSMDPFQRTPNAWAETWRHSHMLKGDTEIRQAAQTWMVQQAFHNTQRALADVFFPDIMENHIDVDVTVDDAGLFRINAATHCVLPYALEHVSDAFWVAESRFSSSYADYRKPPTRDEVQQLVQEKLRYTHEQESAPGTVCIRKNALRGQVREANRTTFVFRTLLHDEACPITDSRDWIADTKEWTVAERVGPQSTRLRTFYIVGHPHTTRGFVPMERIAMALNIPRNEHMSARVCERLRRGHFGQRVVFFDSLGEMLALLGRNNYEAKHPI
ncbi:Aste57867_18457 [Aphanomyces stellatus]|uniref:Aste57867_18457 protein n=1 Tax=Aphanomyces stellatus TaxID=120398 RepID=A0A485LBL3_9STRA|nr:hypothetical protein As57867_018395 [Aphanomyces stellatus]VFT95193.1 Aste57867_18457 [Aphanomyces stellatus]